MAFSFFFLRLMSSTDTAFSINVTVADTFSFHPRRFKVRDADVKVLGPSCRRVILHSCVQKRAVNFFIFAPKYSVSNFKFNRVHLFR